MLTRGGSVATQNTLRRTRHMPQKGTEIVSCYGHYMQAGHGITTYDSATSSGVSGSVLVYGVLALAGKRDAHQSARHGQQGQMLIVLQT